MSVYRALLSVYRALLNVYRAFFKCSEGSFEPPVCGSVSMAPAGELSLAYIPFECVYRTLLHPYKALLSVYRALLSVWLF